MHINFEGTKTEFKYYRITICREDKKGREYLAHKSEQIYEGDANLAWADFKRSCEENSQRHLIEGNYSTGAEPISIKVFKGPSPKFQGKE